MAEKKTKPRIEIDFEKFEILCGMQCTKPEIAGVFKCSDETLDTRIKEYYGQTFSEVYEIYSQNGKISLRREQFKLANKGDRVMLIWLGKQYLNQSDKNVSDIKLTDTKFELNIIEDKPDSPPIVQPQETIEITEGNNKEPNNAVHGAPAPDEGAEIQ